MSESTINLFQRKDLVMELMEHGVPSIIEVKEVKHLYFKELNDSFYAIFMYYKDKQDLHIKLDGDRTEALNYYMQILACYKNLKNADGGLTFIVGNNETSDSDETSDI